MRALIVTSFVAVLLGLTGAFANEPLARNDSTTLWFENWGNLSKSSLIVVSPDGSQTNVTAERGSPRFFLRDLKAVTDGVYNYELTAATDEMIAVNTELDNGRGKAQRDKMNKPFAMNGYFFVSRGVISQKEALIEETK